tara:strand:+ start:674 stop:2641 length:1968 start_codon:yes stop_codon:yes gene_type:complete
MAYKTTPSSIKRRTKNDEDKIAPFGYHYMPDGTLMSDIEHAQLYPSPRVITDFNIDYNDIKAAGETRMFTVSGDNGAVFSLEVTNEDSPKKYYNFSTRLFQTAPTKLKNVTISGGSYNGNIAFPTVTDADQYDFNLFAESIYNTKHHSYHEVRFADNTVDINSSKGSNSNLVRKVIYQTTDVTVSIQAWSGSGDYVNDDGTTTISLNSASTQTITTSRGKSVIPTPFSITAVVTSGALSINRQPIETDVKTHVSRNIDLAPIDIPGENISQSVKTGTINGAKSGSGTTVTIDEVAATVATVGDRITGSTFLDARNITVMTVSTGGGYTFTTNTAITIGDGETITFTNQLNRRWGIDNMHGLDVGMEIKPTTGAQGNGFTGAATIKDYLDEIAVFEGEANEYKLENVKLPAFDTLGANPTITRNASTNVATTVQTGNIILDQQAKIAFADTGVNIFAYGREKIKKQTGYDVEFTDLKAELNKVTATTSAAVNPASTTIPVTTSTLGIVDKTTQTVNGVTRDSKDVILDSVAGLGIGQSLYVGSGLVGTPKIVAIDETNKKITLSTKQSFADGITLTFPNSIISGIGIDNTVVNPYVDTISSLNLTASAAQTLENGQTLTFSGAGDIVTITGNIKINEVGNEDVTIQLDVDKFLTQH